MQHYHHKKKNWKVPSNRLLEAATVFLNTAPSPNTPSTTAPETATQQTNPTDATDDAIVVDSDDDDDATTAITQQARTQPQQRRKGRLSPNVRQARQQSNRKNLVPIDPIIRGELLNLNKAKQNRRSVSVLKKRMMEATRFVLFLHTNHPELVRPDLHSELIVASSEHFSSEKTKDLSLRKIIETTINKYENNDNSDNNVIKFNEISPDIIGDYLCQRSGRQGGGLMRGKAYKNSRMHLSMFF